MIEVSWLDEPPMRFKTMEDLIGHCICGQCYRELKEGKWPSVGKTPCGTPLSQIKEVEETPVETLPCGCQVATMRE